MFLIFFYQAAKAIYAVLRICDPCVNSFLEIHGKRERDIRPIPESIPDIVFAAPECTPGEIARILVEDRLLIQDIANIQPDFAFLLHDFAGNL